MSEDLFVDVMTRLVLIDTDPAIRVLRDSAESVRDSLRQAELTARGVTAGELIEFASVTGRDPGRMERLWQRIASGVDSSLAATRREEGELSAIGATSGSSAAGGAPPATAIPDTAGAARAVSPQDRPSGELRSRLDSLRRARKKADLASPDDS